MWPAKLGLRTALRAGPDVRSASCTLRGFPAAPWPPKRRRRLQNVCMPRLNPRPAAQPVRSPPRRPHRNAASGEDGAAARWSGARCVSTAFLGVLGLLLAGPAPGQADYDHAFERQLFKTRFEHEVQFRAAAIHVAWGAQPLCDRTTQIEPFVLWSQHAMRKRPSSREEPIFRQATGMDDKWRLVWADEDVPEELEIGDVVTAINGRRLPGGGTRFEMGALFRGGSVVSNDDQGYWNVMIRAREEAMVREDRSMTLTLEDGREVRVNTQAGCAGAVTASSFDPDPDVFWRQGTLRAKIPAAAMLEAKSRDEFRWLAAFGTYFQASQSAIETAQRSEGRSTGFMVGKILMLAVPGAGMLLTAVEAQTDKALAVDSIVGSADLFANEVVAAMGGDADAGLVLSRRLAAKGLKVDAVQMDEFRMSNAVEHVRRIQAIQAAEAEREEAEAREQEERQRQPLVLPARAP
jgi:hypothetical protein